jgi:hypothetical protein
MIGGRTPSTPNGARRREIRSGGPPAPRRPGLTRADIVVLLVLIGVTALLVLMGLSRAREQARLAGCTRNLSQIGFALAIYDQMHGQLPGVGTPVPPGDRAAADSPGPLKMLLESLDLPDLTELRDPKTRPKGRPGGVPGEMPVPGFVCAGDPNALAGRLQAPISYRAATGDGPRGDNGPFAPGRSWSLAAIEARDGLGYTAAFSERLVGRGGEGLESLPSYRIVTPPLSDAGCPAPEGQGRWKNDAGSSWIASDYRSTLYNHALTPNARPSCIGADGRAAFMGASSGHVRGINLLRLDGSVSLTLPSIAPQVWRELAAIRDAAK